MEESDLSKLPLTDESILTLVEEEDDEKNSRACTSTQDLAEIEKADEEPARLLQAEEEANFLHQWSGEHGRQEFASRIEGYINRVLQYEDPFYQEAARKTVELHELEEKAAIVLAKEGKRNPSQIESKHALLFQLLLWFKKSFRWVDAAPCTSCGSETDDIGMGKPYAEELRYGADRVELYRCKSCQTVTRFPRYNDTLKLIETRSGRCGEWANCFTLYCRAFGYQARLVLDFTDHAWTECFSDLLNRWVHMDPCEGAFDKPLLYEQGWGKKLNYTIAISNDGVFDVTNRYTTNWGEVLFRRNITSEKNVVEVLASLTAHLRSNFGPVYVEQLKERDEKEADELFRSDQEHRGTSEALPGRQTGTDEWRMARGEMGLTAPLVSERTAGPKRLCVDHHVSKILEVLGLLKKFDEEDSAHKLNGILKAFCDLLYKLRKAPYNKRCIQMSIQSQNSILGELLADDILTKLLQALALVWREENHGESDILSNDPIETALALPVMIETIENLISAIKTITGPSTVLERFKFLAENERLWGGWVRASGEEAPSGIATSAFDGLQSTKWEEPKGSKGAWFTYYLPEGITAQITIYELTSANDCTERDPKDWVLEGSHDRGSTWTVLDAQSHQLFSRRFERKSFRIPKENTVSCNAFRFKFLSIRDSSMESRLQISSIDFFKRKQ